MDIEPRTYGYTSMHSLLSDTLNNKFEIVTVKFGKMIRVKPEKLAIAQTPISHRVEEVIHVSPVMLV